MKKDNYGPGVVSKVENDSAADAAGIMAGDSLLNIDGKRLRDAIDVLTLLSDDEEHAIEIERKGKRMKLNISAYARPIGLEFEKPIFNKIMTCKNSCFFCFVDQLPPGLRRSLYIKDDDYRLSFLYGNFVTLSNLGKHDIKRIIEQHLSPLYVSLHATDPLIRERLFGNANSSISLKNLRSLLCSGIDIHIQLVLVKGVNDGEILEKTLNDIFEKYNQISSIGIVPVGSTTMGRKKLSESFHFNRESALKVIEQVEKWRPIFKKKGPFAADEFFYLACENPPSREYYYDFPQIENGIGLTRAFALSLNKVQTKSIKTDDKTLIITTPMGAWALEHAGIQPGNHRIEVCENTLFGETVNVCGLLPGKDVIHTIEKNKGVKRILVPEVAINGGFFIDGITPEYISELEKVEVKSIPADETIICVL